MDAIVICGGVGSRIKEITKDEIPKIMIPVNGKPFVDYLIDILYTQGVRNITFSAGFQGQVLKDYIERSYSHRNFKVIIEDRALDTAGGVLNALVFGNIDSNPILVLNGDCLLLPEGEDNYEELYYHYVGGKPECCMFTCFMEHDGRYGSLAMDKERRVIAGFRNNRPGESWINGGWYILRREFFDICKGGDGRLVVEKLSMEKDVFQQYLEDGQIIEPIIFDSNCFIDIGTPESFQQAQKTLRRSFSKTVGIFGEER